MDDDKEIKIIKYSEEYEYGVIELLNICFPGKNITDRSFKWKYFDPKFDENVAAYLALYRNKIVAFVCFTPVYVRQGNDKFLFYSCSVQATHPDFRRRGLVTLLTQKAEQMLGVQANYFGFSNSQGVKIDLNSKKINYTIIGKLKTAHIPFSVPKKGLSALKVDASKISFNNTMTHSRFIQFDKSSNYLNWRYFYNPKNTYETYKITDYNKDIGIVITKRKSIKLEILDIIAEDKNILKCINACAGFLVKQRLLFLSFTYLPNMFWKSNLPHLNINREQEMYFTVKTRNTKFINNENWLVLGGDIQ